MAPPSNFPSKEEETPYSTPILRPPESPRRSPSFSSESSSDSLFSSIDESDHPLHTPTATPLKLKGIPFSWEQIPGIPKLPLEPKTNKNKEYPGHLLPPPPPARASSLRRPAADSSFRRDPFFTALVECSKDGDTSNGTNYLDFSSKITRALSHRLGLVIMHGSCKRTCAVSDPISGRSRPGPHCPVYRHRS